MLNPHYHAVFLDGVFATSNEGVATGNEGALRFHPLPSLASGEVADLMQTIRVRVVGWLDRHGVIDAGAELSAIDDDFAEREPALAALARASVSGLLPAGPERRERAPLSLTGAPGVEVKAPLSVAELGFSLHAATVVGARDRAGREGLCKYVLRPPIAQERVLLLDDGLVRIALERPFGDGTVAVDLDPLSLLCRLCAAVPPPKMHLVRYAGVLSAAHKLRPLVVPPRPAEETPPELNAHDHRHPERPATQRCHYWPWARLLERSFDVDGEKCDRCGARMKRRALVIAPPSIERFLRHLGEPFDPPPLSPARGPPFFRSAAVRRKLGNLDEEARQMEIFGT